MCIYIYIYIHIYIYMSVSNLFGPIKKRVWHALEKSRGAITITGIRLVRNIFLQLSWLESSSASKVMQDTVFNSNFRWFFEISMDFSGFRPDPIRCIGSMQMHQMHRIHGSDPLDRSNASDPWIEWIGWIQCFVSRAIIFSQGLKMDKRTNENPPYIYIYI